MNSITAKEFLIITTLVSVFVGLSYGLDCYYCDPEDIGCDDPVKAGRPERDCGSITGSGNPLSRILDDERSTIAAGQTVTYLCAALHVINKDDKNATGIFRTCVVNTTTADHCNVLKDTFARDQLGQIVDCKTCNGTLCNNFTIDAFKNSSPESFTSVLLYTFLSSIFVVYVI